MVSSKDRRSAAGEGVTVIAKPTADAKNKCIFKRPQLMHYIRIMAFILRFGILFAARPLQTRPPLRAATAFTGEIEDPSFLSGARNANSFLRYHRNVLK